MLSASHNPMPDNGLKFLARGGVKLDDVIEDAIEQRMREPWDRPTGAAVGRFRTHETAAEEYAAHLDSTRGALVMQRDHLAHFTYQLHYLWHELTGRWLYYLAGVLSLAWLLVIVSGVLIHLKDVVRQFHQFRPQKRGRLFWADLHKVLSMMGLPFQTVFAYSGAFMVLGPLVAQLFVKPVFAGDLQRATKTALGYTLDAPEKPGAPATPTPTRSRRWRSPTSRPRPLRPST